MWSIILYLEVIKMTKEQKNNEVELRKDEAHLREEVVGTDGRPVWIPTVDIGSVNKLLSNQAKMIAFGWTAEELERTAKFAPRAARKPDGKGAYRFVNGKSYRGFGSMYDALESEEERARQHGKGVTTITREVAKKYNKTLVGVCMKLDTKLWDTVLEGTDETTLKVAHVLKGLKDLKADQKVINEFLGLFE